jgi:hypothetical protein
MHNYFKCLVCGFVHIDSKQFTPDDVNQHCPACLSEAQQSLGEFNTDKEAIVYARKNKKLKGVK